MRGLFLLALGALLALGLVQPVVSQKKAILGIDIGNGFMKVAVIQHGRLPDIATNTASKRKTETAVGFDNNGHRLFAGDAANAKTRTPLQVYSQLPSLLGVSAEHPLAKAALEQFMSSHEVSVDEERGTVVFTHPRPGHDGSVMKLSPEELTAMLLGYAKAIGEDFAAEGGERSEISDCVLTVPSFYTQTQRQALLDAARIANLKVLSLVDANTAAAVQYGLDRKEDKTILIFNMGAENSQASLVRFTSRPMDGKNVTAFKVEAKAWENNVGGAYLTAKVRDEFAKEYTAQRQAKTPDYDAFQRPRALARLEKAADKTKQILSANKASPPVYVSSVDNDVDYKGGKWERARLEGLAGDFFERALLPVERVLKDAGNLTIDDVDFVEVIGGGLRVPKMQQLLREYFHSDDAPENGVEIGVHLNGDEAVALGAVFVAANRSRSFRVRHVDMTDVVPFQINVELNDVVGEDDVVDEEGPWSKEATLVPAHRPFKRTTFSFVHTKDLELALRYQNDEAAGSRIPEGTPELIAQYSVTGVEDAVADERYAELADPKVKLTFEADRYGLIRLSRAYAEFQETVIEQVEKRVPVNTTEDEAATDDADDVEGTAADSDDEASVDADANADAEVDADADDEASDGDSDDEAASKAEKKKKKKKKKQEYTTILVDQEKVVKHKVPLNIEYRADSNAPMRNLSEEELRASQDFYQRLQAQEQAARDLENARNELETFLYSARDILSDTKGINEVLSEDDYDDMREGIMDNLDWLEDEDTGLHASIHQVRAKKTETKEAVEAVLFRLRELELRPKAVEAARAVLAATADKIAEWSETKPQLTEEEFSDLRLKLAAVTTFLDESEAKQAELTNFVAPAFTSTEVSKKMKSVQTFVERLMKKPAPVPVVPEDEDQQEENADSNDEGETDVDSEEQSNEGSEEDSEEDSEEEEQATSDNTHDDL